MAILDLGTKVKLRDGSNVEIIDVPVGSGGQGTVYKVKWDGHSEIYALKIYDNHEDTYCHTDEFRQNLKRLVDLKKENPDKYKRMCDYFTMPLEVTEETGVDKSGFVMEYLDKSQWSDFYSIATRKIKFKNVPLLVAACYNISYAFGLLDWKNLTYVDINQGSVLINTNNSSVKICDCDNIVESGIQYNFLGTSGYIAPELVTGKGLPTKYSNYHSLAVLLFNILLKGDPLEGQGTEHLKNDLSREDYELEVFGNNPHFVMNPDNENKPLNVNVSNAWGALHDMVKELFNKTFINGLKNPSMRASAAEWNGAFHFWTVEGAVTDPKYDYLINNEVQKKLLLLIYVVDDSKSMDGVKLTNVNYAINEVLKKLNQKKSNLSVLDLKIGILTFSTGCKWLNGGLCSLKSLKDGVNIEINKLGIDTRFDNACMELDEKLTYENFLKYNGMRKHSTVILITDGYVDENKYIEKLNELKNNKNFRNSNRYAIGIDNDSIKTNKKMLIDFTDDDKKVVKTDNLDLIVKTIIESSMSADHQKSRVRSPENLQR